MHLYSPESVRQANTTVLVNLLQQQGVKVVQIGQTMRIIIPGDLVFRPHSANISNAYMPVLNNIARLMLMLETTSAMVEGNTNLEPSEKLNVALSTRQAQVIQDYLWERGLDTRLLYAIGCGSRKPIVAVLGAPENRRIEITFQFVPMAEGKYAS